MARTPRAALISAVWILLLAFLTWHFAILPVSPEPEDEYGKWLGVSLLFYGLRWLPLLVMLLVVGLSLNSRITPARLWIVAIWTGIVAGIIVIDVFAWSPTSYIELISAYLTVSPYKLCASLVGLWIAFIVEREVTRMNARDTEIVEWPK